MDITLNAVNAAIRVDDAAVAGYAVRDVFGGRIVVLGTPSA
jgi:hypothetical protein